MTVSIAQAENIWSVEPAAVSDLIYGKNEKELVSGGKAGGKASGGTVLYKLGENGSYSEEISTAADAGTYTVYCKAEGNQNYTDIAEQSFTVQIAPKEIEFIWGDTELIVRKAAIKPTVSLENWTEGETLSIPEISGNDGNAEVTFTYKSADSEEFTPDVPTESGNYTVKATIAESDNYFSGSAEAQFTIEEAPAEIHAELQIIKFEAEDVITTSAPDVTSLG